MASSISITTEHRHDANQFSRLITGTGVECKWTGLMIPGGYSIQLRTMATRPLFHRGITSAHYQGDPLRGKTARTIRKMGDDLWKKYQWISKTLDSGDLLLRSVMGEFIRAKMADYMIQEVDRRHSITTWWWKIGGNKGRYATQFTT